MCMCVSLADKWEILCPFPFNHLQMFPFPASAAFFYFSNMQMIDDVCLAPWKSDLSVSWTLCCPSPCPTVSQAPDQTEYAQKKQIRGCVCNLISIFPAWGVLSRPLLICCSASDGRSASVPLGQIGSADQSRP